MTRKRSTKAPSVPAEMVANAEAPIANGLGDALGFGTGIGGGVNPLGFPGNQGAFGTEQISNTGTIFRNLRWYLVSNFRQMLSQAYVEIGLIQTIVDVPIDDGLRGGVMLKSQQLEEDQITALQLSLDRDGDLRTAGQAGKWNRLFGVGHSGADGPGPGNASGAGKHYHGHSPGISGGGYVGAVLG